MFSTYAKAGAGVSAGGTSSAARGKSTGPGGWHPDVLYLLGLTILEIVVVGFLSRHLLG